MDSVKSYFSVGLLLVGCALGGVKPARSVGADIKPEDEIQQLEREWLAADGKGDAGRLSDIVADDFMGGSPDGRLLSKQDIIPRGGGPGAFAGAAPKDTAVRVFGDTAVLMGAIKAADSPEIRVTLVCQKRAKGWQMIAAHLSHP